MTESSYSPQRNTVLVCGSLHLDVLVNAPHLPGKDETVVGTQANYVCGGKGGNQAVAARLNGASVVFAGCIGDDEFGNQLHRNLLQHDINCTLLQKITGSSGMSVAIVDSQGDYGAVIVSGSNLAIAADEIKCPESTGILLLQNEVPQSTNITMASQANALDVPVMLNAAPFREMDEGLIDLLDILVLNRVEAEQFLYRQLFDQEAVAQALNDTQIPIETVIVTLGEDGLVYRDKSDTIQAKQALPVTVESTHGAGDMFCGALASQITLGAELGEALDYAMAAAAWHVRATLDERPRITREAIIQLMVNHQH